MHRPYVIENGVQMLDEHPLVLTMWTSCSVQLCYWLYA